MASVSRRKLDLLSTCHETMCVGYFAKPCRHETCDQFTQCGVNARRVAPNPELSMSLRDHPGRVRGARTAGSTGPSESNPMKASEQMSYKDRLPLKPADAPGTSERATGDPLARESEERDWRSATPLEFGADGEIEFKEAVPRRRNDVLRILREEAAHAAVEEQHASVQQAPIQAGTADESKAVRSENSQLIVRTGKRRNPDGSGLRTPTTASSGWLRAFIFAFAAIFALAAFAFQFALDIGNWLPWLQPYLTEYVQSVNRLAASIDDLY